MHEPAAIERAISVLRHMSSIGGKPSDFAVAVTAQEGFELIEWFRAKASAVTTDLTLLDADIDVARASGDPWLVLQHYELLGLAIARRLH